MTNKTQITDKQAQDKSEADDERRDKFIYHWLGGDCVQTAGIKAGYSKHYSRGGLHAAVTSEGKLRNKISEVLAKLPDRYRDICKLNLIKLSEAEVKAVDRYVEDPDLLIKSPTLAKDIKRAAGVIEDERPEVVPMIRIEKMQGDVKVMIVGSLERS